MKKRIAILAISIIIFLTGCYPTAEKPYEFRQSLDQIETIEIALKKEYDPDLADEPIVLKTLDVQEHQAIIEALLKADGNVVLSPPGRGIGVYIVQITYKNGELELIGEYNNGYITPEGEVVQHGYIFNREQLYEIISYFLGEQVVSPTLG